MNQNDNKKNGDAVLDSSELVIPQPPAIQKWLRETAHQRKKHDRSAKKMLKAIHLNYKRRTAKSQRRMKKWMRAFEKTLNSITMPPDVSSAEA